MFADWSYTNSVHAVSRASRASCPKLCSVHRTRSILFCAPQHWKLRHDGVVSSGALQWVPGSSCKRRVFRKIQTLCQIPVSQLLVSISSQVEQSAFLSSRNCNLLSLRLAYTTRLLLIFDCRSNDNTSKRRHGYADCRLILSLVCLLLRSPDLRGR